jgi:hypothetical protein
MVAVDVFTVNVVAICVGPIHNCSAFSFISSLLSRHRYISLFCCSNTQGLHITSFYYQNLLTQDIPGMVQDSLWKVT